MTQTPPATQAVTLEQLRQDARQAVAQWSAYPQLPSRTIRSVISFAEKDGLLVVQWPIFDAGATQGRIDFSDLPGTALITYMQSRLPGAPICPSMQYWDVSQADAVRHLQVLNTPFSLQVVQDIDGVKDDAEAITTVSLIEQMEGADANHLTLRVHVPDETDLVRSAPTLSALRRQHPMEYERYLRPLFNAFHQEQAVFAVDDQIAWQVVADGWKEPPDLRARLAPIIARLNADDFSTRETAQRDLVQIGEPAALYLLGADRSSWSAEQKARVDKLLAEYCPLSADQTIALSRDVNFLLDCLGSPDPQLRAATLEHLDRLLNRDIAFDANLSTPDRFDQIEALRSELNAKAATRAASN